MTELNAEIEAAILKYCAKCVSREYEQILTITDDTFDDCCAHGLLPLTRNGQPCPYFKEGDKKS